MYQSILVPIDPSEPDTSKASIETAKTILRDGGIITLLSVLPTLPPYVATELPSDFANTSENEALEKLKQLASEQGLPDTTPLLVTHGSPYPEILENATKNNSDLVIVASHQPGWETYLLGSTAAQVVRHAKCSVLVIR